MGSEKRPAWWDRQCESTWERIKEALRRDWEQTKAHLSDGGTELNQDLGDTIEQAIGTKPLPPPDQPTPDADWSDAEPALRYGQGARRHYADEADWNDRLEGKLRDEWTELETGRSWDQAKDQVKRGWNAGFDKFA
jgi:hypothetical protein